MKVKRMIKSDVDTFRVGDIIKFKLTDGEKVQAMAVQQENDSMLFCLVDCLADEYSMNDTNTNEGGYEGSDLRKKLNTEIIARFPADIKAMMVPFGNGDYLRLPTEKEIFGENYYGEYESPYVQQWKPMKQRRNRMAFQGKNGGWEWYWLQNKCRDSAAYFVQCQRRRRCELRRRFWLLWRSSRFQNQGSLIYTPLWGVGEVLHEASEQNNRKSV